MNCTECNNELRPLNSHYYCDNCKVDYMDVPVQTKLNMEDKNMGNIKDEAQGYEPPQTKTIDLLEKVPLALAMFDDDFLTKEGKNVHVKMITVDGEDYRVPNSVLKDLKVIIEEKPDMKFFKVSKTGEGLKTKYTVITLD